MRTAFLAVFGILLGTNLINLGRNAESRPYTLAQRDSLWAQARDTHSSKIHQTFAVYYYLRDRLPRGATLTLPQYMRSHAPRLREVSGFEVEVAPGPIELDAHRFKHLRKGFQIRLPIWIRGNLHAVYLRVENKSKTHYVFVQEEHTDRIALVPWGDYQDMLKRRPPPPRRAPFGH